MTYGCLSALSSVRGLLVDLDGTLYLKDSPLPGAIDALARLRDAGIALRFVTNTSACLPAIIAAKVRSMGFRVDDHEVFTPVAAARQHLAARGVRRCHFLLNPSVMPAFVEFDAVNEGAEAIVLGDMGEGFTFAALNSAFRLLRAGAELVILQKNPFWFAPDGPTLDCGAFAVALEFAAGREGIVVGKPNRRFFELALESLNVPREAGAVIGDDWTTDVVGAASVGLPSVLLRTGKFNAESVAAAPIRATLVLDSFAEVPRCVLAPRAG
jgi:HAD superfamily hydrolase (TIGR01458 family)